MNVYELCRLAKLADWQLKEMGYNPQEITALLQEINDYLETKRLK